MRKDRFLLAVSKEEAKKNAPYGMIMLGANFPKSKISEMS